MSAARIIRALLGLAAVSHRAFCNSEPLPDASHARVLNDDDYRALTRALFQLGAATSYRVDTAAPLRAELELRDLLEKLEAPAPTTSTVSAPEELAEARKLISDLEASRDGYKSQLEFLSRDPQPVDGVRRDLLPGYLIDHCEGDMISEEGLQHAVARMLKDADYLRVAATGTQAAPEEVRELIRLRTIVEVASKFDMTSMRPITENDACRRILALRTSTDQADTGTGSQIAPSSALPSRPDYWNGVDTTGAQFDALARQPGAGNEPPSGAGGGGGGASTLADGTPITGGGNA